MALDSISLQQLQLAERSLYLSDRALDLSEPSCVVVARERASGERCSLPSADDVRHLLTVIDNLSALVREVARQRNNFRAACEDRDRVIAQLLHNER